MLFKFERKVRRLIDLLLEHRNVYNVLKSIYDYYKISYRAQMRKDLLFLTLPNGLKIVIFNRLPFRRAFHSVFDEIFIQKIYEKHPMFVPKPTDIVLDLGAFIGLYTLKHHHAQKVYSIEALPTSYVLLKTNVELNDLNNIITYNFAVSDSDGSAYMFIEDYLISGSTLVSEWHQEYHKSYVKVRTLTIDSMFKRGLIPSYIDIAKVDIEGTELQFLQGGQRFLERGGIERLVLELHNVVDKKNFYFLLRDLGFKPVKKIQGIETEILYLIFSR
ncbi:MAG: FkbM family methyltransferase [Nitrososphaerota archaeon]